MSNSIVRGPSDGITGLVKLVYSDAVAMHQDQMVDQVDDLDKS